MAPAPSGVRDRAARQHDRTLDDLLAGVYDQTIAMAIRGVQDLQECWMTVPRGGTLRLFRPLARDFFAAATASPRSADDQGQPGPERPGRARPSGEASTPHYRA